MWYICVAPLAFMMESAAGFGDEKLRSLIVHHVAETCPPPRHPDQKCCLGKKCDDPWLLCVSRNTSLNKVSSSSKVDRKVRANNK
jgi:hypothetical protein